MKRLIDIILSFTALILTSPILLLSVIIIYLDDFQSPFYIAKRVGKDNVIFNMIKLRSMRINADKTGVDSTGSNDKRITKIGKYIRKYKTDELPQLWNILIGEMSLVGPRPNVPRETYLYTNLEKSLLTIKPGLTDFASIVFSDEGEILKYESDPDIAYHQLIRPGKNKLSIYYVNNNSILVDICLIFLTILAIINKKKALLFITLLLKLMRAPNELVQIASRNQELVPTPPPGSNIIVTSRNL